MWRCVKCGGDVADSLQNCWTCGTSRDGIVGAGLPPVETMVASKPRRPPRPQVGMPRRFSIGAAMMLTAIFAILFGILRASDAPPVVFFVTLVFVAAIAMCQALLFGGKNPRKASILVGIVAGVLVDLAFVAVVVLDACYHHAHVSVEDIALMAVAVWAAFLVCTAFGYVIGWFVAAIFLVRKESDDPIVSTKDASGETRALGLEGNEQCGDVPNVAVK